ncbi:MAG: fumarylacetoacetate hydrolase family protein [Lautropia sp.]|nr:fumarylacetoacetate hydrolase family protein [Lautropia sp.]
MSFVFAPAPVVGLAVTSQSARFPVHRVFCVGQNYADHAIEMGSSGREAPFFFMKPARSVVPAGASQTLTVPYPAGTSELHHEVELVVAIGQEARDITADSAAACIWGYAVGLDLTRRDLQAALKAKGRPWEVAKGFEASAPVGPVTPVAQTGLLTQVPIRLDVNDQPRQQGNIDQMIWKVNEIIAHLSQHWQLMPGDLVFTGTPAGVSALQPGDRLRAEVAGLAPLQVTIG